MSVHVGLDVGSRTTAMGWRDKGRAAGSWDIAQTPKGRKAAVKKLIALKPLSVVMEATGIYYLDLALELSTAGLPVSVINPKSSRNFARLMLQHSKTDAIDAQLLAEYGERMTPRLWTPPSPAQLELRAIGRHINRLTCHCTRAKNELHALQATETTSAMLIEDEEEAIAMFGRRIERFRRAGRDIIASCPILQEQFDHMVAAPGMGEVSTFAVLAELTTLPVTLKSPQISRYAGLDVRLTQSGTSIDKPGRLSKGGNAYLRSAMFMPAMSAIRCDPYVKAFYDVLVGRGKRKMQAICAVMRKYLTGLWACIRAGEDFDTAKLFSEKHLLKA
ncbi:MULTISPECIES: IS110 family transposase [Pseudomonas]|uniref:IS110 family transposase n=6 Tax=Pseudomonas TaxID=286 RepID=A0ABY9GWE7_9PSED|nr:MULTISPECIES: IS110 family transposase [unclassified Pseudomonas]WLI12777.1 IS110 family transposase [Pseudomonas sp. FP603]WLI14217.1 IS110 family transposase [Pseudomonas sp. FP603]WLI15979.1 IS110 family transposase [Pseudomonas sp. FP607]WLI20127.1 IS110 family transposase [Pseudomonas sp. FP607]